MARMEAIDIDPGKRLPDMPLTFTGCRSSDDEYLVDIVDVGNRQMRRWAIPFARDERWPELIRSTIYPDGMPLCYEDYGKFCDEQYMTPHVAQLTPQGKLLLCFGVAENGFAAILVDTQTGQSKLIESPDEPRLYVSTGDFDADYEHWYYADWPATNSLRDSEKEIPNEFDLRSLNLSTMEQKSLYVIRDSISNGRPRGLGLPRRLHQVTRSMDGRFIICAPFDYDPNVPYPLVSMEDDPEGYRRTHEGGLKLEYLITVDLQEQRHWFTEIPIPVPAHVEFDLDDPRIFYASAHNIAATSVGTLLEGPAALFKLRIGDGRTDILSSYSDPGFFRITQHSVFRHAGKTLVAVTCVPNRLVILDAETMQLWRNVVLFEADPIVLSDSGVLSPEYAIACYSLNPSTDERHIVLENAQNFIVYDLVEDRILDERALRYIPPGYAGRGHTRTLGQ
jgi:hypothetical protein